MIPVVKRKMKSPTLKGFSTIFYDAILTLVIPAEKPVWHQRVVKTLFKKVANRARSRMEGVGK